MIILQPVLEILATDGFDLWPVADPGGYDLLPLSGALSPDQVGTAVMRLADCNDAEPGRRERAQGPVDPLGHFLHGLLTSGTLWAPGGLRATDTATGVVLSPGCCNGLDERHDWREVIDGEGWADFGHSPSPLAERIGDVVRLTVDTEQPNSPTIEVPLADLPSLLADAERDLAAFLRLATTWSAVHIPDFAAPVCAALGRALAMPAPVVAPNQ
ncbi:hypothetical protein [Streptomyces roseoviridis]|uniref:SUKH-4 immunity protein of toxin-antitoxin system n=1 Tax=Streptomyces roseoviridis TaxID=67361 RepID=A0ABV5QQH9_9ACTN